MARRLFFSFDYENVKDFRVNVVRNSQAIKKGDSHFFDNSMWEKTKTKGEAALIKLIDSGLSGSSVTAVLIGSETYKRKWVKYELVKSFTLGKGIFGITINRIRSANTSTIDAKGPNPFEYIRVKVDSNGKKIYFEELVNGKWQEFKLLPVDNNRLSNTLYFGLGSKGERNECGQTYKFSQLGFRTYDWVTDNAKDNLSNWIESTKIGN